MKRLRAGLCLVLALAGSALPAHAARLGDNTVRLAPSELRLPQNIGPLRYAGENRYTDRRLGRSFAYNAGGISLNLYVYDHGRRDIPDGPDSVGACEQFESAKGEIERGGNYENVVLVSQASRLMDPPNEAPRVREAVYEFDRRGSHAVSVLWLTAADGVFVKVRLSMRADMADELDEARTEILAEIARAAARRPARAPRASGGASDEPDIELASGGDPVEGAAWLAYGIELARAAQEHPQLRPACGGVVLPDFTTELGARRAALAAYRARDEQQRVSPYFAELERVDDGGFLAEYVWHYLHDDAWPAAAPAGLELPAFEDFRNRQLSAHVAQSGARVRIDAVRVLPPPPAPR